MSGKWYPYEESIRVPLIIRDPRMPKSIQNTQDDAFTLNIDLAPTILGAAGLKAHESMQGRDIADLYLQQQTAKDRPWRNEFFYEYPNRGGPKFPASTALVRKEWKYMFWPELQFEQLFHISVDPKEQNDTKAYFPQVLEEMRARHNKLQQQIVESSSKD